MHRTFEYETLTFNLFYCDPWAGNNLPKFIIRTRVEIRHSAWVPVKQSMSSNEDSVGKEPEGAKASRLVSGNIGTEGATTSQLVAGNIEFEALSDQLEELNISQLGKWFLFSS